MVSNEVIIEMRKRNECMENERKTWTDEDSKALGTYYDMGFGITEIAVILKRSERAVFQQLSLMGAFQSPIKRSSSVKVPECLCANCKVDPAFCANECRCARCKETVEC